MKRLILILVFSVCWFVGHSQEDEDTTKYIKYNYTYGVKYPRVWASKVLRLPQDTIYSKAGLAIKNGVLYFGDETKWDTVSGGSGGGGSGTVDNGTQYRIAYYAATGTTVSPAAAITGSRLLVSDANGVPTHSTVTTTEAGYLSGVTSAIQTQINSKVNISDTSGMLTNYIRGAGLWLTKSSQHLSLDTATLFTNSAGAIRRKDSLTASNLLGYVTRTVLADTAADIRTDLAPISLYNPLDADSLIFPIDADEYWIKAVKGGATDPVVLTTTRTDSTIRHSYSLRQSFLDSIRATPGIDDVLAEAQDLTTNRTINANANTFRIEGNGAAEAEFEVNDAYVSMLGKNPAGQSQIIVDGEGGIVANPHLGIITIDTLNHSNVSTDKIVVWDSVGNQLRTRTIASIGGGVSDGDKGDITVSGSGATWTIDNGVVTFAKMQAITDNRLLGAQGGTTVEEIALTANDFDLASNTLSIDYANGQAASASVNGFMTTGTQTIAGAKTYTGDQTIAKAYPIWYGDATAGTYASLRLDDAGGNINQIYADGGLFYSVPSSAYSHTFSVNSGTVAQFNNTGTPTAGFPGRVSITGTQSDGVARGIVQVERTLSSLGNNHRGYRDGTIFQQDAVAQYAYAGFDADVTMRVLNGKTAGHVALHQARGTKDSSGTVTDWFDFVSAQTNVSEGNIVNKYGLYVYPVDTTGTGTVTNQVGIYIPDLTQSTNKTGAIIVNNVRIGSTSTPTVALDVTGDAKVSAAGTTSTSVVTNSATQTLSNKRWVARVGSTTSSATPTINTDNVDVYKLTAQAADITSFTTNLSGTPNDGDVLVIEITGTASRAITWGSAFVSGSTALPTTTSGTTTLTTVLYYSTTSSYGNNKWVCSNYW